MICNAFSEWHEAIKDENAANVACGLLLELSPDWRYEKFSDKNTSTLFSILQSPLLTSTPLSNTGTEHDWDENGENGRSNGGYGYVTLPF